MSDRRRFPRPFRGARNAAYRIAKTDTGVETLRAEIAQLSAQLDELSAKLDAGQQASSDALAERAHEIRRMLRLVYEDEPGHRERLWQERARPEYELAFDEQEPLVTVTIPTYRNTKALLERALPSILAQTYERLEVIVVGDAAEPEVAEAVARVGDGRVTYANLTHRGPYPKDPEAFWNCAGAMPANEGLRLASGRWVAPMNDDDHANKNHVEVLLNEARARRLEFCYGKIRQQTPDGAVEVIGEFPPRWSQIGLQASIMHPATWFFEAELGVAAFGVVGDWARVRRMMRAGVRIGMVDQIVLDYYPGRAWGTDQPV